MHTLSRKCFETGVLAGFSVLDSCDKPCISHCSPEDISGSSGSETSAKFGMLSGLVGNHGSHLPECLKFQSVNVKVPVKEPLQDMHDHLSDSQLKTHYLPLLNHLEITVNQCVSLKSCSRLVREKIGSALRIQTSLIQVCFQVKSTRLFDLVRD